MPNYRLQLAFVPTSQVLADRATNTFHFTADDLTAVTTAITNLQICYAAFANAMGAQLASTNNVRWKLYDMADPEPRVPESQGQWSLTRSSGDSLPTEVALAVSFQAVAVSGIPQARRRGRIFIPFLLATVNGANSRPATATVNQINGAFDAFLTASKAASTWKWAIYSPTNANFVEVDNGWIDDEWDTQRKRGRVATTRTVFS